MIKMNLQFFGGRGASSEKVKGRGEYGKALELAAKGIDETKTGASFRKLSSSLKRNIDVNLTPSKALKDALQKGNTNLEDTWKTSVKGVGARQVISKGVNGKIEYTVKNRNKILLKTTDKNKAANKIAEFYLDAQKQVR